MKPPGISAARRGPTGHPRGQALVEFAMVAGILMLVVGALVQFSLIMWTQGAVTEIARETARWAVTQYQPPCDTGASRAQIAGRATIFAQRTHLIAPQVWSTAGSSNATTASGVGVDWFPTGKEPRLAKWTTGDPPIDIYATDCPPRDGRIPWSVRVRVSHVVPIFFPAVGALIGNCPSGQAGYCVTSTTELRMEPKVPQ